MRTTIDLPDDLFRTTKARAALEGRTLKAFVREAIEEKLRSSERGTGASRPRGWRRVFGSAAAEDVGEIDEIVRSELSGVEPETWR